MTHGHSRDYPKQILASFNSEKFWCPRFCHNPAENHYLALCLFMVIYGLAIIKSRCSPPWWNKRCTSRLGNQCWETTMLAAADLRFFLPHWCVPCYLLCQARLQTRPVPPELQMSAVPKFAVGVLKLLQGSTNTSLKIKTRSSSQNAGY